MNNNLMFSSDNDNWKTPIAVYEALDGEFHFDFDPCPLNESPEFNGLAIEWGQCSFVNPPFSNIAAWCKKAYEQWLQGKTVVMLIPSRTDTIYWHKYIMQSSEIRFIKGRLKFGDAKNSAPFPSVIVVFSQEKTLKEETINLLKHIRDNYCSLPFEDRVKETLSKYID